MRTLLVSLVSATLLPLCAHAADPRNGPAYHVIFDLEAHGSSDLVNGYGAYVEVFDSAAKQMIRYCENFEGHGTGGRPNPKRDRFKPSPIGRTDDGTAYHCRDYSLADAARGQPLIAMGNKMFFAMKTDAWSAKDGGEILFQFAKKIPLIGSPTYKTLRVRATRSGSGLDYVVETVIPKGPVTPAHFFLFEVSGSGLGFPNGITGLTANPTERSEKKIDIDGLEGPIMISGTGKSSQEKPLSN